MYLYLFILYWNRFLFYGSIDMAACLFLQIGFKGRQYIIYLQTPFLVDSPKLSVIM